jgi:hypothetical protein
VNTTGAPCTPLVSTLDLLKDGRSSAVKFRSPSLFPENQKNLKLFKHKSQHLLVSGESLPGSHTSGGRTPWASC